MLYNRDEIFVIIVLSYINIYKDTESRVDKICESKCIRFFHVNEKEFIFHIYRYLMTKFELVQLLFHQFELKFFKSSKIQIFKNLCSNESDSGISYYIKNIIVECN